MSEIVKKLRLDQFQDVVLVDCPADKIIEFTGLKRSEIQSKNKLIFSFVTSKQTFVAFIQNAIRQDLLEDEGILYIAYPKKGNPLYPDYVHRDEIFGLLNVNDDGFIGSSTYKFNRMVGFDEVFTILGIKKTKRSSSSSKTSQSVGDYVEYQEPLRQLLSTNTDLLDTFDALTPGYKRDWARYVYSTANESTRVKRFAEMKEALKAGHKSITLYRAANKNK